MKDLKPLHFFLGIEVIPFLGGLFLSQQQYARDILSKASMSSCNPTSTPLAQKVKLHSQDASLVDATNYRSLIGALQYLTLTRPDLTHAVNLVCQFLHRPRLSHLQAVKCITYRVHYIMGYDSSLFPLLIFMVFLMLIGLDALTCDAQPLDTLFIWVLIVFLGPPRSSPRSPALVLKLNIELWPLLPLNLLR